MEQVHLLWYMREYEDRKDTELFIGVYATADEAQAVVDRLKLKEGFREHPEGFLISATKLGHTSWEDGFYTTWGPPPKDAEGEAFDLPAWLEPPSSGQR